MVGQAIHWKQELFYYLNKLFKPFYFIANMNLELQLAASAYLSCKHKQVVVVLHAFVRFK